MKKTEVPFADCLKETSERLSNPGILLTTIDPAGKPNTMTIGWGVAGIIWGIPTFCVLVRPSRYTYALIEQSGDFTVNVTTPEMDDIATYCGTTSGRDIDKFVEMDLTAIHVEEIKSPIISECPINFICKVVHKNDVIPEKLDPEITDRAYKNGDFHRVYYGQILKTLKTV